MIFRKYRRFFTIFIFSGIFDFDSDREFSAIFFAKMMTYFFFMRIIFMFCSIFGESRKFPQAKKIFFDQEKKDVPTYRFL